MLHQSQRTINIGSVKEPNYSYWLKFELIEYCKENGLSVEGSKKTLKARIALFLSEELNYKRELNLHKTNRRIIKKVM